MLNTIIKKGWKMHKVFVVDKKTRAGIFIAPYPKDVVEYLSDPNNYLWIDFYQPNYDWIKKRLNLNKYILDLCIEKTGMPYFEKIRQNYFVKLIALNPKKFMEIGDTAEINFILAENLIISLHDSPVDILESIELESDELSKCLSKGTDNLFYYFFNLLLKNNFHFANKIQDELDFVDFRLFNRKIFKMERRLFDLKKVVYQYKIHLDNKIEIIKEIQAVIKKQPDKVFRKQNYHCSKEIIYKTKSLIFMFNKLAGLYTNISESYNLILNEKRNINQRNMIFTMVITIIFVVISNSYLFAVICKDSLKYFLLVSLLLISCFAAIIFIFRNKKISY